MIRKFNDRNGSIFCLISGRCTVQRGEGMRMSPLQRIAVVGFILLVVWELWKASFLAEKTTDSEISKKNKWTPIVKELLVIDQKHLTTYPEDMQHMAVQRVRMASIAADCIKRSRKDLFPPGASSGLPPSAFSHILVSDRHQLLYCVVPKVACTNWKRVLMVLEGFFNETESIPSPAAHNRTAGYLKPLSDYSPDEISHRLATYYKFLFVRHPFERLASAFRNKFVESKYRMFKKVYGKYIMRKYRSKENRTGLPYRRGEGLTFNEFVKFIIDSPADDPDFYNEHWERIDRLCHPCLITYDFIGKFETLKRDADYLLRSLEVSDVTTFPMSGSRMNSTSTRLLVASYFSGLPKETIDKLYELYRHDFQMFNYHLPDMPVEIGAGSVSALSS